MIRAIARKLPPGFISWLGRIQFRHPTLAPVIRYFGQRATSGISEIQHGPCKGLWIDNTFGLPGYALGTTEPEEQQALKSLLKEGDVFWNVGANIGFVAMLAARRVGASGEVVAFEPIERIADAARRNLQMNAMQDRSHVIATAVSDHVGQIDFFVGTHSGLNSMVQDQQADGVRVTVATTTLDSVAQKRARMPNVISIDVEGAEILVFNGAREVIRKARPAILLENHWLQPEIEQHFTQELQPLGYRWLELDSSPYVRKAERRLREHSIFVCEQ